MQKGISQVDMAHVAEISRSAYIAFENKDSENLTLKSAVGISQKLGVSMYDLFEIENHVAGTSEAAGELIQLREKVKELEKRIEEKDLVINLLKRENQKLTEMQAWDVVSEAFHELLDLEISMKYGEPTEKDKIILQKRIDEISGVLQKEIDNALFYRYLSTDLLIGIFAGSGLLYEDDANSKSDYIKQITQYMTRFISVDENEVAIYFQTNEITKWDTDKLKNKAIEYKKFIRKTSFQNRLYKK